MRFPSVTPFSKSNPQDPKKTSPLGRVPAAEVASDPAPVEAANPGTNGVDLQDTIPASLEEVEKKHPSIFAGETTSENDDGSNKISEQEPGVTTHGHDQKEPEVASSVDKTHEAVDVPQSPSPQDMDTDKNMPSQPETPLASPGDKGVPTQPQQRHREGQKRPFDEGEDEFLTESKPPPELSKAAICNRLRRVFSLRKAGSRQVDERWVEAWNDINGGGRDDVLQMFEKLAYDRDRVELKLWWNLCGNTSWLFFWGSWN